MGKTNQRVRFHTGNMTVSFCGSKSTFIDVSADVRDGNVSVCDFKLDMLAFQDGTLTGRIENGLGSMESVIVEDGSRNEVEEPV